MADQKVSDLPSLNGVDVDPADLLYIVDSSAGTAGSKKITMGQFDVYTAAVSQTLTNKTISGADNTLSNISLASSVTGTLPVANGGTGATTLTGVVKGNGTSAFTAGNVNLTSEVTGTLPVASGGTGSTSTTYCSLTANVTGTLPIANGGTGATTLAGANIPVTNAANTFTATQTFSGSSSALAMVLNDAAETATVSATAATGTINYDVTTQSVLYYTSNASGNWTVNFRASSGTSLNTAMSTGQSVTAAFLVTQGSTPYYNNVVQVDGSSVTPKWQGGLAPAAGNASGVDAYVYTIIKTGAATFTVFASQTRFA